MSAKTTPNTSDSEESHIEYSKMTTSSLKKLLEKRNIEGRSKLTTKSSMISALVHKGTKEEELEEGEEKEEKKEVEYSKMTTASLKKLLEQRNVEGRSRLTTKDTMIKVLELFDQDPQDKTSISAFVAEISTPRKKKNKSESSDHETTTKKSKKEKSESSEETSEEKPKKTRIRTKKEKSESSEENRKKENTDDEEDSDMVEVTSLSKDIFRHMKFMIRECKEKQVLKQSWINQLKEIKQKLGLFNSTSPVDINDE